MKSETFPQAPHFAAIIFKTKSINHEGDERSRTHPSHGYPTYTETINYIEYLSFSSREEMEKWVVSVETKGYGKPNYKLIEAKPLKVKVSAVVDIN